MKWDWAKELFCTRPTKISFNQRPELQTKSRRPVYDPLIWVLYQEEAEPVAVGRCWGTLFHLCHAPIIVSYDKPTAKPQQIIQLVCLSLKQWTVKCTGTWMEKLAKAHFLCLSELHALICWINNPGRRRQSAAGRKRSLSFKRGEASQRQRCGWPWHDLHILPPHNPSQLSPVTSDHTRATG